MELIPIFSLIVLVATFGTFVLAIGAYVLFRVRERRGRSGAPQVAATYDADVIAPEPLDDPAPVTQVKGNARRPYAPEERLAQYTPDGYAPLKDRPAEERKRWR